jgi:hypothetical protein
VIAPEEVQRPRAGGWGGAVEEAAELRAVARVLGGVAVPVELLGRLARGREEQGPEPLAPHAGLAGDLLGAAVLVAAGGG